MNLPMRGTPDKTIYARVGGINLPPKIKRLLIGSEIVWFDKDPLSQDFGEALHFYFETKTNAMADLLLKKHGLTDVSQFINIRFNWGIEMELVYSMPNRRDNDKIHKEIHYFEFSGMLYPLHEKFKENRDVFLFSKKSRFLNDSQRSQK